MRKYFARHVGKFEAVLGRTIWEGSGEGGCGSDRLRSVRHADGWSSIGASAARLREGRRSGAGWVEDSCQILVISSTMSQWLSSLRTSSPTCLLKGSRGLTAACLVQVQSL
ncbi:hypothetical protein CKAH01_03220 [Colletotrichum kahawae]|uniref:Uncharacterized protein n=1 Tax=Colletotrichum kahawae TaxID=34407 RepID=A0AAD9YV67_COLKA|nr:hypothetical protein CKAH01_03220 [Colletotrichum kahawae]